MAKSEQMVQVNPAEYFALCPLDGRYAKVAKKLSPFFSEYALMKNRTKVEVYWLKFLIENFHGINTLCVTPIYENFSEDSFRRIKEIESETNHDVKAVEIFVGEELKKIGFDDLVSYVHIGCTSEDINNTAYARMIYDALNQVWIPAAEKLISKLVKMADDYKSMPMLAHTHGQPATPTTVGKEMAVYAYRLRESLDYIKNIKIRAKFNGATGNYSAISVAFPDESWVDLSRTFVESYLCLDFNPMTTQIESHDYICHLADCIRHFNNVLLDLDRDMWLYISMEYFKQIPVKSEVGSSTMPHKVNPIRFENSEANVDMANAVLMALSNKLAVSRLQRDLSDSSSLRNLGMGFGYSLQAIEQTIGGLAKVAVNEEKISSELNDNWEVLAEPIQTMLRKYKVPDAYNKLKELTRGRRISKEDIQSFIEGLDILSEDDKKVLLCLTPASYVGLAAQIAQQECC